MSRWEELALTIARDPSGASMARTALRRFGYRWTAGTMTDAELAQALIKEDLSWTDVLKINS